MGKQVGFFLFCFLLVVVCCCFLVFGGFFWETIHMCIICTYSSLLFKILSVTTVHANASVIFLCLFCNNYTSNTYASVFVYINIFISADVKTYVCIHIQLLQSNQYVYICQRWICISKQSSTIQDVSFEILSLHLLMCSYKARQCVSWKIVEAEAISYYKS